MDQWKCAHLAGAKQHVTSCGINKQNTWGTENTVKCKRGIWTGLDIPSDVDLPWPGPTCNLVVFTLEFDSYNNNGKLSTTTTKLKLIKCTFKPILKTIMMLELCVNIAEIFLLHCYIKVLHVNFEILEFKIISVSRNHVTLQKIYILRITVHKIQNLLMKCIRKL